MPSPTVRSRQLAQKLRRYREAAGVTQAHVAHHLNHTIQWISRTENAKTCRPSVGDVRSLLSLYGVTDTLEIAQVVALATEARQPGWWQAFDLSSTHGTFVALEAEAESKLAWEPQLIPGLLQVPGYARVVIASGPDPLLPGRVEELVRVRMERQKVLFREAPLIIEEIIDEAVLRRVIGTPALMKEQLQHLCEQAEAPNVTLRVLPDGVGAHPAVTGPFTILRYPDDDDHDVLYCETPAGMMYAEHPADAARANRIFSHLKTLALSPRETIDLAARYAADL